MRSAGDPYHACGGNDTTETILCEMFLSSYEGDIAPVELCNMNLTTSGILDF